MSCKLSSTRGIRRQYRGILKQSQGIGVHIDPREEQFADLVAEKVPFIGEPERLAVEHDDSRRLKLLYLRKFTFEKIDSIARAKPGEVEPLSSKPQHDRFVQ